ncbi:hypothetical protein [Okeania sp. SIO2B3]|uniref:hypothetical protein n=1 Tax=Okeania sp. SIO2B3 TaxID=2607784 RepID=UPI0013C09E31|nr:hypothetical protein [Okeania sp. SIO2B3]NET41731.1 hypothetical protein [Okeania sp. SIO2B3]
MNNKEKQLPLEEIKNFPLISCPVASVLYSKGKEEGRGKREEKRGKKTIEQEKPKFPVDIHS